MDEPRPDSDFYTIELESRTSLPRAHEYVTEPALQSNHEYVNVAETNLQSELSSHVTGTERNLAGAEYYIGSDTRLSVHEYVNIIRTSSSLPHEYANITDLPPSYNDVISCSSTDPPSYSMVVNVSLFIILEFGWTLIYLSNRILSLECYHIYIYLLLTTNYYNH